MHRTKFGTSSNDTTGERHSGHHYKTCRWQTLESAEAREVGQHRAHDHPGPRFNRGEGSVLLEGVPRGPPRRARLEPRPLGGHVRRRRKHNVAPYFCVQKDFAPSSSSSSSNCRPGASSQLARRWAARHIRRPPVHLGKQPTPPRREGSSGGRPPARATSLLSRQRQPLPRPARPADRAAPPADETREEPRGRAPSRRSGPAQPTHLPGPARSPGPPAPEPVGGKKARPRGSTARRRPRPGEPEAAGEAGTLGLSGGQPPPSRARQDAWGLVRPAHPRGGGLAGPGPGPPPQAGRIRRGPRPRAGGGRVPAAGRAGRPAGGRRVAAAPGLK